MMSKIIDKIKKHKLKSIFLTIFCILIVIGVFNEYKKLPENINYESETYKMSVDKLDFLYDLTYENEAGERIYRQEIFDEIFSAINDAEKYILIDMFLFNSYKSKESETFYRDISKELVVYLIERKNDVPDLKIDFITDPINIVYGGGDSAEIKQLQNAGINVIYTDLSRLHDSNFIYSSIWRMFFSWFGNTKKWGILNHPFGYDEPKVSLRTYLKMLNFKANHRKVFVADSGDDLVSIVMSANPHNGSSAHSNVGIKINGEIGQEIFKTENAVADFSNKNLSISNLNLETDVSDIDDMVSVKLITENKIKENILLAINESRKGDRIGMAMFYLADRHIIDALIRASMRDVDVKIVLDANRDAFGYKKIGIPNRQVASELTKKSMGRIKVRWYDTNGEQFHSKLVFVSSPYRGTSVILGSANFTRRNLNNYNLETDIFLNAKSDTSLMTEVIDYFDMIFENKENNTYTIDYSAFEENTFWKIIVYYIQEYLGLSSF